MRKGVCITIFLFFFASSVWCLPFIGVDTGLLFMINTEKEGAPNPVILQGLGATLPLINNNDEGFFLDAGMLIFLNQYQWYNKRAIPADSERSDTVEVVFVQLDLLSGILMKLTKELTFGASLGPALVFPFPLFAYDNGAVYINSMYTYFYSNVKFLYAETELLLRWAIMKELNLTFKIRAMYQLAALWDDPAVPRINGMTFQGIISIEIRL
jgi:hypothetical protein